MVGHANTLDLMRSPMLYPYHFGNPWSRKILLLVDTCITQTSFNIRTGQVVILIVSEGGGYVSYAFDNHVLSVLGKCPRDAQRAASLPFRHVHIKTPLSPWMMSDLSSSFCHPIVSLIQQQCCCYPSAPITSHEGHPRRSPRGRPNHGRPSHAPGRPPRRPVRNPPLTHPTRPTLNPSSSPEVTKAVYAPGTQ